MPIARHLQQLTRRNNNPDRIACAQGRTSFCLALLPMGFTQPTQSPESLVRSYRTVSPLPGKPLPTSLHNTLPRSVLFRRFAFCCTCPILADGGRYPPSCPVEPGLSSPPESDAANDWPSADNGRSLSGPTTLSEVMRTEVQHLFGISARCLAAATFND